MKGLLFRFLRPLAASPRDLVPTSVVNGLLRVVVLGQALANLFDLRWGTALVIEGMLPYSCARIRQLVREKRQ